MAIFSAATVPDPHADDIPTGFRAQNDATHLKNMYACMYVFMLACTHVFMYVCMHVCMYAYTYVHMYVYSMYVVYMYARMYTVYMYACMWCVYITQTHTHMHA
jgi:hypothetical protein